MINTRFEVYKLKKELKRSGTDYDFFRAVPNERGEPTNEKEMLGVLRGLYHEQNSHITLSMSDTTQVRSKPVPSILCLYNDVESIGLTVGDKVKINKKVMKVTGVVNIQEWCLIADVSLEVVDNGI